VALPYTKGGVLCFPESFVVSAKRALSPSLEDKTLLPPPNSTPPSTPRNPPSPDALRIAAIIIDPGHGGKDPGAIGEHRINGKVVKFQEKEITLNISKSLQALLKSAYPDKRILMTRTGDTFPSLEERVAIANSVPLKENEAIIYISIHVNSSLNKTARGYEVWYLKPEYRRDLIDKKKFTESAEVMPIFNDMLQEEFNSESTRMAKFILNRFTETLGNRIPSRGMKAENWYVVRNARMPSVLVELGFISNLEDVRLMTDAAYLKHFSEALYKGIADFVAEFEQSGGYIAQ
jgi:N-acetylmuramoyl-L-alanine amidase